MGRANKRKNRTHLKGVNRDETQIDAKSPKSFVIKSGQVGASVSQLVRDIRKIMEPGTATRLRERASARLRDYLVMAPALNVTHLIVLTLSAQTSSLHLRLARLPAGPTLTFRIERYSLMRDLVNAQARNIGRAPSGEFRTPPLLVLSNFNQSPDEKPQPQLKLMSTLFQGMFPPIQIDKSALPSFRRVLLISYHSATRLVSVRHYTISIKASGVSKRVKRVLDPSAKRGPVDLGDDEDIADYLLRTKGSEGYETGSETEGDSETEGEGSDRERNSSKVELPADYVGRGNRKGQHRAVRLVEMGPRIEMRLVKVVEGIVGSVRGEGETVFHEFVHKSSEEKKELKKTHAQRTAEKAARKKEQEANVARKKEAAAALKTSKRGQKRDGAAAGADDEAAAEGEDDEDAFVHDYTGDEEFDFEDRVLKNKARGKNIATREEMEEMSEDDNEDGGADSADEGDLDLEEGDEVGDVSSSEDEMQGGESSDEEAPVAVKRARPTPVGKKGRAGGRK